MTPQARAEASARAMWERDAASQGLGMSLDAIAPGAATLSMTVTGAMTNGHKTCHGGFIFTLADSAFAFACNSYNQNTVAQMASVTFLAPAFAGDRLTAQAHEVARSGRSGIYDIRVTNASGAQIAEFRGHSRTIKGSHFPEPETEPETGPETET
ncbi:hydroxyphenylacetyl-CoA thioesterase PaaI [Pararhodobacter sp.]|uniref:hydroxyphenylacetyl-CoA thioesterase PaaI n=1 Tax=Pararhodobacter sp. TaxID=2127056 RepID=UPI002FDC93EC